MQVLICSPVSRFAYQVDNLKGEPTLRGLLSALPATAAVVDVTGTIYSDNVLQTDMVVPAGMGRALSKEPERAWGSAWASEQTKAALEEARPFRSARGDDAKAAVRYIFHFPFKGPRLPIAGMQRQLATTKPPTR